MNSYIGITIGPIGDTMSMTSSPAGLWGASYLFSYLAHEIRSNIRSISSDIRTEDQRNAILSDSLPVIRNNTSAGTVGDVFQNGVGLYHDRIIYAGTDLDSAAAAIKSVVHKIAENFAKDLGQKESEAERFFRSYFNIHAVRMDIKEKENPLLAVNQVLDLLELKKNFPGTVKTNYILDLYENYQQEGKKNSRIKKSFLVTHGRNAAVTHWVLAGKDGRIRNLESIAANGRKDPDTKQLKYTHYYAVIRADGDNMGKTIRQRFNSEEELKYFSDHCLRYGCRASELVQRYGGITIYAGGDDLLCIAPVMTGTENGMRTFLDLIGDVTDAFDDEFREIRQKAELENQNAEKKEKEQEYQFFPMLSFGVQIQYVKAPLYEALEKSGNLLFGVAKHDGNKPNALAVNLMKHSGQSAQLLIRGFHEEAKKTTELINELIKNTQSKEILKSVGPKVTQFASVFETAAENGEEDVMCSFFQNVIKREKNENAEHQRYIDKLLELALHMHSIDLFDARSSSIPRAETFGNLVRFIKFFSETTGDE